MVGRPEDRRDELVSLSPADLLEPELCDCDWDAWVECEWVECEVEAKEANWGVEGKRGEVTGEG